MLVWFRSILFAFSMVLLTLSAEEKSVKKSPIVCVETTQGNIEIRLLPEIAPKACENFIQLVQNHYYDQMIFHRIIQGFMIQGGDPTQTGAGGSSCWGKPFEDEVTPKMSFDKPGLLAMANAGPNTNGSQFFITTVKAPWLNMKHTIFGEVISGYETVQKLEKVKTNQKDRPLEDQKILRVYIKEESKPGSAEK